MTDKRNRANGATAKSFSDEEVNELIARARRGDQRAFNELIVGNMGLVFNVIHSLQCSTKHVDINDLVQVGRIALYNAILHFEPGRKNRFCSYATTCVTFAIKAFVRENHFVMLSTTTAKHEAKMYKAISVFYNEHGYLPTEEELEQMLDFNCKGLLGLVRDVNEIDAPSPLCSDEDHHWNDRNYVSDERADDELMRESDEEEVRELLAELDDRTRYVVMASYGIGMCEHTQGVIAAELGVSSNRVG